MTGKDRRTLFKIKLYPTASDLYFRLMSYQGWQYKTNRELYLKRDRALVAVTYLLATRISETIRLRHKQIELGKDRVYIRGIELSKAFKKGKLRKELYRKEAWLSLEGERSKLTQIFLNYITQLEYDPEALLFPIGTSRCWQIITKLTGETPHYLRAYGENYLYDHWERDLLAVSDYIKVDPRTLALYIKKGFLKYSPV